MALYCDILIPHFGMLPRVLHYHCVNAKVRFNGLVHLNTARSVIALISLILWAWLSRFSASDLLTVHSSIAELDTMTIYTSLTTLLMANFILFEQLLPPITASTDAPSASMQNLGHPGNKEVEDAWRNLGTYLSTSAASS